MYERIKIINGNGTFYTKYNLSKNGCKWTFQFSKNTLTIKTIDEQYDCSFGFAVYADGVFKKSASKTPEYFENDESKKIFFKDIKPENYNKN